VRAIELYGRSDLVQYPRPDLRHGPLVNPSFRVARNPIRAGGQPHRAGLRVRSGGPICAVDPIKESNFLIPA
jgi:hypothetical protein